MLFIYLEKIYSKVLGEFLWKALENLEFYSLFRVIKDMYDGIENSVRTHGGVIGDFPIAIGLHQGSDFESLSFYLSFGCWY